MEEGNFHFLDCPPQKKEELKKMKTSINKYMKY